MWPVSANWLAALAQSHARSTRAEVWYNGAFVTALPIESGAVQVTARNRIRRTLTAYVPEAYWPFTSSAALAPYGAQVKVWQSILGGNGQLIGSEIPVFTGRVEEDDRTRLAGKVYLIGLDPFADVNDAQFEQPRTVAAGIGVIGTIIGLITEVRSDARITDLTGSTAVIPAPMMWEFDRGQAIDDLAGSIGAEVFCQPDGVSWIIRPIPSIRGAAVWTLQDGQGGTMIRDTQKKSRTDVANRIIVHVEQPGQTPQTVTVSDDGPASVTRYGGPYGKVVRHYRNPLIGNVGQAGEAGQARLARSLGATRTRDLDTIPNPALEAGDVITVKTSEGTETHIADSFPVPLEVATVMTVTTRSTGTSTS